MIAELMTRVAKVTEGTGNWGTAKDHGRSDGNMIGKWLLSHLFAALVEDLNKLGRKPTCLEKKKDKGRKSVAE